MKANVANTSMIVKSQRVLADKTRTNWNISRFFEKSQHAICLLYYFVDNASHTIILNRTKQNWYWSNAKIYILPLSQLEGRFHLVFPPWYIEKYRNVICKFYFEIKNLKGDENCCKNIFLSQSFQWQKNENEPAWTTESN